MYRLNKTDYELLKSIDFSSFKSLKVGLQFNDDSRSFETDDILTLQIALNHEIALNGMTKEQNEITAYGCALYALYDAILEQIE